MMNPSQADLYEPTIDNFADNNTIDTPHKLRGWMATHLAGLRIAFHADGYDRTDQVANCVSGFRKLARMIRKKLDLPALPKRMSDGPWREYEDLDEWAESSEGLEAPRRKRTVRRKGKRGKPPLDKNTKQLYRSWVKEWATGKYKTYALCAAAFGPKVTAQDIAKAKTWCRKNPPARKKHAG